MGVNVLLAHIDPEALGLRRNQFVALVSAIRECAQPTIQDLNGPARNSNYVKGRTLDRGGEDLEMF